MTGPWRPSPQSSGSPGTRSCARSSPAGTRWWTTRDDSTGCPRSGSTRPRSCGPAAPTPRCTRPASPTSPPGLPDVVEGRSGTVLAGWLGARDEQFRAQIVPASLDPFRGYATALTAQLPKAVRVLDAFHVVKLALTCVDEVRRRTSRTPSGTAARPRIRCSGPVGCCAAARTGSPSSNAPDSSRRCWPATRTTR